MLHTDAFNKSNKRKMTKADYVKNTRLPGVYPEVLDVSHRFWPSHSFRTVTRFSVLLRQYYLCTVYFYRGSS